MTSTTATSETPVKNEQTTSLSPPTLPTTSTFENMNEIDSDSNVFTELVHEQMMISDKDFEERNVSPSTLPTTSTFEFNNILLGPMWSRVRGNLLEERNVSPSTLATISTFENMNENEDNNVFTELVHEQMLISDKDLEERNVPTTTETSSRAIRCRKFGLKEHYVKFNNVLLGPLWNRLRGKLLEEEEKNEKECEKFLEMIIE
jgi:hypothetical protein